MPTFEQQHPRGLAGKFTEKSNSRPSGSLTSQSNKEQPPSSANILVAHLEHTQSEYRIAGVSARAVTLHRGGIADTTVHFDKHGDVEQVRLYDLGVGQWVPEPDGKLQREFQAAIDRTRPLTPAQVRTPEFSVDAFSTTSLQVVRAERFEDHGGMIAYLTSGESLIPDIEVDLSARGDVVQVHQYDPEEEGWDVDPEDEKLHAELQGAIVRRRLEAAGFPEVAQPSPAPGAGMQRVPGSLSDGHVPDVRWIAGQVRKGVKRAKEFGAIPHHLDVRVTSKRPTPFRQDLSIVVSDMPRSERLREDPVLGEVLSWEAKLVRESLSRIAGQRNTQVVDLDADYDRSHILVNVTV